jgi:ATP/maltotriose-dependent transcriptional regulator MalT
MREILTTRLLPPRLPERCLPREDLVEQIARGLDGRLVAIVAGAGYGKSTVLAQVLGQETRPWVFLSCDERLGDDRAFLAHLAAGIGERFPGVGSGLALEGSTEECVEELLNELIATVADDLVVAIDDIHGLDGQPAVRALSFLVRGLPPNVHLALASRRALPFLASRFRASGMVEVGERQLALSEHESVELLRLANPVLADASVADLSRRCEGWLAGLLLAAQAGGVVPDRVELGRGGPHAGYLVEAVLGHQNPSSKSSFFARRSWRGSRPGSRRRLRGATTPGRSSTTFWRATSSRSLLTPPASGTATTTSFARCYFSGCRAARRCSPF